MRRKLPATLLILSCLPAAARDVGQVSDQTSASSGAAETQHVVMPNTPSGAGNPDAIVCRAPQPIAGSDQSGPQVCLQNSEWWKMAMEGNDLAPDGTTLIDRPMVDNPKGDGDPDAITCRTRKVVSHWTDRVTRYGPVVCRPNSFWADVIKSHQRVDPNGNVVPRWSPDYSGFNGLGGSGYGGGSGMPDSGNMPSGGPTPH